MCCLVVSHPHHTTLFPCARALLLQLVKKTVQLKGGVPVDEYFDSFIASGPGLPSASDCHVIAGCNVLANQTDIKTNANKFYIAQAISMDSGSRHFCCTRWGRVGEKGQNKVEEFGSAGEASNAYSKKKREKVKPGKYTEIAIKHGGDGDAAGAGASDAKPAAKAKGGKAAAKAAPASSSLHPKIQDLIKLIFDMKLMTKTAVELEYDINKMPLGQLTKATLLAGFDVLKQLDEVIEKMNKEKDKKKKAALLDTCEQLSSAFYTVIPHAFGRQRPPVIASSEQLATKVKMVETLAEIQIATKLMSEDTAGLHELDANFAKLKCDMEVLDEASDEFKMIEAYTANTYETGKQFGYGSQQQAPAIDAVYKLGRDGEDARFKTKAKLGNRKLLWHGSRITNYVGILSQGLRIAPPEAPCSGYRFGKGVYFADMCSLSARYCRTYGAGKFAMLLGDVALGKEAELSRDKFMTKSEPGTDSTKALGRIEPDPKKNTPLPGAKPCVVPLGPPVDCNAGVSVSCHEHQYVIYDTAQCKLQYLIVFQQ